MKKILAIVLAAALLCAALPLSALAFDPHIIYGGQTGCRLASWTFTQANNAWLLWDVTFKSVCDGRVLETEADHPNLIGRSVIPTFDFEGDRVTFNGEEITSDASSITLKEQNDLVVFSGETKAEYQISITEKTNGVPVVLIDT
ncbi:MAG: hypothetical protein IJU16_00635, partial [Clostridia bacterium]|nr:hypothetical protein [Clostridia bacterium]